MRDGEDYHLTIFEAQTDALNIVYRNGFECGKYCRHNDNGGRELRELFVFDCYLCHVTNPFFYERGPEVLVSHTMDLGQITKIHGVHIATVKIGGHMVVQTAIAVGKLALKRRETKNLRQRIIVFVASQLNGPGADGKFSKNLKNNNVKSKKKLTRMIRQF